MTTQQIINDFSGKIVGTRFTKHLIAQTLFKLPEEVVNYLTKNVWFLSSVRDGWAYTFKGDDLANQHMIFLSDELLEQDLPQIQFTILHEIGHVMLKHRNAINYDQPRHEIKKQEQEADEFAKKYLN